MSSRTARASLLFLAGFGVAELGVGLARAATTTYVPVLLDRISDSPALIGAVMLVNAAAGFLVPLAVGVWSDRRRLSAATPWVIGGVALTSVAWSRSPPARRPPTRSSGSPPGVVYVGLNATATAHRAVIVERFRGRPAARGDELTGDRDAAGRPGRASAVGGVLIGDAARRYLFVSARPCPR